MLLLGENIWQLVNAANCRVACFCSLRGILCAEEIIPLDGVKHNCR